MSIGILKTITVDFSDDAVYQYVAVKSEEVFSRVIEVILMNDGAEYIIPQGTTARLEARKSDNVPILIDGTIDYTLNRIYFSLTPKCTEIPGVIQCEIALYGEDNRLAISSFFYIDVHRSVLSGTGSANGCGNNVVSSSPEYEAFRTGLLALDDKIKQSNEVVGVVQKQMEEAREALDIATEAAETIVTARDEAFLAAESANNSASLANEATQAANEAVKTIDGVAETATKAADEATLATQEAERIATAVVTAENARVVAEQERVSNETTRKNDEAKRVIAENNRVTAETARVEAEKLRVRESADAVDDAIDAATAANAASQNANNAIANLNTAINNANVAASYANQATENVITTNGKMIATEAERESAEETRQANESTRINQENARVDAELERESAFATAISNAETATQNANDAAQTAIEASQEASLQEAREAAISASESANAAADRATSFLDDAEANEEIRKSNEISRVSAEENRRTEFATWEIELGKISAFDKRIENIEAAVSPGLVTPTVDDSVAYSKDVPTGALPNAMISEVGGMTYNVNGVLQDAKATAVESVGANSIPYPYKNTTRTDNGITYTVNNDGSITINGTCTATNGYSQFTLFEWLMPEYEHENLTFSMLNSAVGGLYAVIGGTGYSYAETATTATINRLVGANNIVQYGYIRVHQNATISNVTVYPMLNKGETALPYTPYREKETFPIPEAVQALEGYGQGIIKEYHNKIVLDPAEGVKKFVKNVGKTNFYDVYPIRFTDVIYYGASESIGMRKAYPNAISNISFTTNYQYFLNYNGEIIGAMAEGTLYIKNPNFPNMTDEEITEYLKSVELVYELETPTETDISDYFGDDNLIGVEGGGTVTMVNEHEYDVPSVIEYTVKGVDAT